MGDTRCPLCKLEYHCLKVYGYKRGRLSVIRNEKVKQRQQVYEGQELWMQFADACYVCGIGEEEEADANRFIVCDACDWLTCHMQCIGLQEVPEGEWIC